MKIEFQNNVYWPLCEEDDEKLDAIAKETVVFLCEKLEELGDGISYNLLNRMSKLVEMNISRIKFKSEK